MIASWIWPKEQKQTAHTNSRDLPNDLRQNEEGEDESLSTFLVLRDPVVNHDHENICQPSFCVISYVIKQEPFSNFSSKRLKQEVCIFSLCLYVLKLYL